MKNIRNISKEKYNNLSIKNGLDKIYFLICLILIIQIELFFSQEGKFLPNFLPFFYVLVVLSLANFLKDNRPRVLSQFLGICFLFCIANYLISFFAMKPNWQVANNKYELFLINQTLSNYLNINDKVCDPAKVFYSSSAINICSKLYIASNQSDQISLNVKSLHDIFSKQEYPVFILGTEFIKELLETRRRSYFGKIVGQIRAELEGKNYFMVSFKSFNFLIPKEKIELFHKLKRYAL